MGRPSFPDIFLAIAEVLSRRATCPRARVGAVIVDRQDRIVGCGYNGAPPSEPHCDEVGCILQTGKDGYEHCMRVKHADRNAIENAPDIARLDGATMYIYSTLAGLPVCDGCQKAIDDAGIGNIVISYGSHI